MLSRSIFYRSTEESKFISVKYEMFHTISPDKQKCIASVIVVNICSPCLSEYDISVWSEQSSPLLIL